MIEVLMLGIAAIPPVGGLFYDRLIAGTVPRDRVNEAAVNWYIHTSLPAFPPQVSAAIGGEGYDPFCAKTVEGLRDEPQAARYVAQYLSGGIEVEQLDKMLDIATLHPEVRRIQRDRARRRLEAREQAAPAGYVWDRALERFVPMPAGVRKVTHTHKGATG